VEITQRIRVVKNVMGLTLARCLEIAIPILVVPLQAVYSVAQVVLLIQLLAINNKRALILSRIKMRLILIAEEMDL
jgi:hypothetical protein